MSEEKKLGIPPLQGVEKQLIERQIFTFNYKMGSVCRQENIRADSLKDAVIKVNRYLRFKQRDSFSKVLLSGKIKPFAIDIEEEIIEFNRRAKIEGTMPYEEPSADHPVPARIMAS